MCRDENGNQRLMGELGRIFIPPAFPPPVETNAANHPDKAHNDGVIEYKISQP
jgi:hypothetical protein